MRKRLDEAKWLNRLITTLSDRVTAQLGLIPVIGIAVTLVGFILLLVNVFADTWWLEFPGVLLQGLGIIVSLIGLLLAEPLGK
ncbi:MAG: hypothetical protein AAF787_14255 [Chloroflexota bacterium]